MAQSVLLERNEQVATILLNRPEKLNIINSEMVAGITEAATELARDDDVLVVVVRGAGERAFTAGVDVNEMRRLDAASARGHISRLHQAIRSIRELEKVVIAAVNGYCFGGGFELALACDLRIATEDAKFGLPEIKVGIPSVIEAGLLPLLVNRGRALEMVFLGDNVTADEALKMGLVNRVVPAGRLDEAVKEYTDKLTGYSPTALRMQKRIAQRWVPADLEDAIAFSIDAFSRCFATREPAEAMTAFLEKRLPRFDQSR